MVTIAIGPAKNGGRESARARASRKTTGRKVPDSHSQPDTGRTHYATIAIRQTQSRMTDSKTTSVEQLADAPHEGGVGAGGGQRGGVDDAVGEILQGVGHA